MMGLLPAGEAIGTPALGMGPTPTEPRLPKLLALGPAEPRWPYPLVNTMLAQFWTMGQLPAGEAIGIAVAGAS